MYGPTLDMGSYVWALDMGYVWAPMYGPWIWGMFMFLWTLDMEYVWVVLRYVSLTHDTKVQ